MIAVHVFYTLCNIVSIFSAVVAVLLSIVYIMLNILHITHKITWDIQQFFDQENLETVETIMILTTIFTTVIVIIMKYLIYGI